MSVNPPIQDWQGRIAWLIGATSGIGLALAHALHLRGATVIVSGRRASALEEFAATHARLELCPLDTTDAPWVERTTAELQTRHGSIDFVWFGAAIYQPMSATEFDLEIALRHVEVNLNGALNVVAHVLPVLRRQAAAGLPAHLCLVASVAGYRGLPKALAYGPTKAALIHLAESLHLDLSPSGIGVSLVNPGFVRTPLTAGNDFHMPALIEPEEAARQMILGWAAGRFEIHFPRRFTWLMKALRCAPWGLYEAAVRRVTT